MHFRHTVVAATLVKAGFHRVLPLDVEEVRNSDGQDKQDCEISDAKRLIARQEYPQLPLIRSGDDLYCNESFIVQLRNLALHHTSDTKWLKYYPIGMPYLSSFVQSISP